MNPYILQNIVYSFCILIGGLFTYHIIFYFIKKGAKEKKRLLDSLLSKYIYYPGLAFSAVLLLGVALYMVQNSFNHYVFNIVLHALKIVFVAVSGFLSIRTLTVFRELTLDHYTTKTVVDYSLRKAKTKFQLIQRILNFIITLTCVSIILMTFDSIRQIGTTLLASAGVLGLVIGFAAQKSLGTFFAGLQIAISQPIRIDDVVVVEDQFGTVAEITLTYVVINIWDGRRLIVPINYFLEKPFENWTRSAPTVVGKVKLHADYSLPVNEIRNSLKTLLDANPLWDKRSWGLLVTSANEKTIELRASMSAKNSDDAWALECFIREELILLLQTKYPHSLPKSRLDVSDAH